LDGVDGSEGKTEQSISLALDKLSAELARELDGLVLDADAAQNESVSADVAAGSASVSIRDLPGAAFGLVEGGALGGIEDSVTFGGCGGCGRRWQLGAPDPEISRAGVKVEVQRLRWSADRDSGKVQRVLFNILGLAIVSIVTAPASLILTYRHVACLATAIFLGEHVAMDTSLATNALVVSKLPSLSDLLDST
jgi:hypothetical protein